jgi:hypothetical protein
VKRCHHADEGFLVGGVLPSSRHLLGEKLEWPPGVELDLGGPALIRYAMLSFGTMWHISNCYHWTISEADRFTTRAVRRSSYAAVRCSCCEAVCRSSCEAVRRSSCEAVRRSTYEAVRRSTSEAVRRSSCEAVRRSSCEAVRRFTYEAVCRSEDDCREKLRHHLTMSSLHNEVHDQNDLNILADIGEVVKEQAMWDPAWDEDSG